MYLRFHPFFDQPGMSSNPGISAWWQGMVWDTDSKELAGPVRGEEPRSTVASGKGQGPLPLAQVVHSDGLLQVLTQLEVQRVRFNLQVGSGKGHSQEPLPLAPVAQGLSVWRVFTHHSFHSGWRVFTLVLLPKTKIWNMAERSLSSCIDHKVNIQSINQITQKFIFLLDFQHSS
jgi:hypothetical protein